MRDTEELIEFLDATIELSGQSVIIVNEVGIKKLKRIRDILEMFGKLEDEGLVWLLSFLKSKTFDQKKE